MKFPVRFRWCLVFPFFLFVVVLIHARGLEVRALRCDSVEDPLGIDSPAPHLSWKLHSTEPDQRQSAWQVLVASSAAQLAQDRGDLWDSGQRNGPEQLDLPYAGRKLHSSEQVFWKVRVWDGDHRVSAWSAPATWTMGVLTPDDWHARWITDAGLLHWVRPKIGYHSQPAMDPAEPEWVRIDLGRSRPIKLVRLYPMRQVIEEGQGLPRRFKIEASDDPNFSSSRVIADYSARDFSYAGTAAKTTVPTFAAPPGIEARYVRVMTTELRRDGPVCYLALSQVEIVSNGQNVAAGATVTAKDSIEDERWSAAALTDGLDVRGANPRENGTLLLRREFAVKPALRRAVLHVSGLGSYHLTLNGREVTGDRLSPGWTTYEKTALYDTYDVTSLLRPAAPNAAGLVLADGMYNVRAGRYHKFESLFRPVTAICQLRLEYDDGSVEFVGTDENWTLNAAGPTTFANVYGGEDFDARRKIPGWNQPGFEDATWSKATVFAGPGGVLRGTSHAAPPLRPQEILSPVTVKPLRPGVMVYDLGQNAALMPRLRVHGPAGAVVKISPSELLKADGSIDTASFLRGPQGSWLTYTLAGSVESEEWSPLFIYNGCRYLQVELQGSPGAPSPASLPVIDSLEGVVVHTSSPPVGEFACSNELFNRIDTLIRWAQRSNLMSLITDCPHREKLGWLEQYYLNGPSLRYDFDLTRLYAKTFDDMADAQRPDGLVPDIAPEYVIFPDGFRDSPEWGSAFILAAWQHYEWTADDTPLRRHYAAMCRYAAYLASRSEGHILSYGLGDWYDIGPKPPGISQLTPLGLTATATYFAVVKTLAAVATHLWKNEDAQRFATEAGEIRGAFNRNFFDSARGVYATGSQCANAMPLVLGLAEPADRARVLDAIVRDVRTHGLTAGDVGYHYLLRALADGGRGDVVFAMNNQSDKPGYGYQLAHGATSLTEAWDARRTSSQDHFMLGQIMEWFYHDLAGIQPDPAGPGFAQVVIRPSIVGDLSWVRASYESARGSIATSWRREGGRLTLDVTLPPNVMATVYVPTSGPAKVVVNDNGGSAAAGVQHLRDEPAAAVFLVGSGQHRFTAPAP